MSGKANVYERVVEDLKRRMECGALPRGEKLPSVRVYALEHKINPNTVARAYAQLEAEGYIEVLLKKGAFVTYGGEKETSSDEADKAIARCWEAGVPREALERALRKYYGENDGL